MQKPSSRQQRGRSCTQSSIQWVLQSLSTVSSVNLPQRLVEVHKNPMLGPGIVTNLGTNPQRPETGRQQQQQPQCPTQGKSNINQNNFPCRDYRYSDQPRQTRFNEKQNQMYSPYHFAPSPALSAGSDLLSHVYHAACRNTISFS